jgi:7-keto-8-aminopelargonate synthetase-like enzyme
MIFQIKSLRFRRMKLNDLAERQIEMRERMKLQQQQERLNRSKQNFHHEQIVYGKKQAAHTPAQIREKNRLMRQSVSLEHLRSIIGLIPK